MAKNPDRLAHICAAYLQNNLTLLNAAMEIGPKDITNPQVYI